MATRDVQIRLTTTGLDKAIASFDELSKKIDGLNLKIDDLDLKLDRLGAKKVSPSVSIDGLDESLAKVAVLSAALDALGRKKADASIGTEGGVSSAARKTLSDAFPGSSGLLDLGGGRSDGAIFRGSDADELARRLISEDVGRMSGLFGRSGGLGNWNFGSLLRGGAGGTFGNLFGGRGGRIGRLFGGGLGGGGGAASAEELAAVGAEGGGGGGGGLGALGPWGIGAGIALASTLLPSAVPFGIGALTGGGALYGAYEMGSSANTQLQALISGGASASTIAAFQRKNATALGLYNNAVSLGQGAKGLFTGALNANATQLVPVTGAGRTRVGTAGVASRQIPGTSFMSGAESIFGQVGSFVKTIGVQNLGETFRASLPFIQTVVKSLEDFVNLMGPAITNAMKEFTPYLPIVRQAFKELSQGIADFLKYLGPGMKSSAEIFKGVMDVVKGLLIVVAVVASALANKIMDIAHGFHQAGTFIADFTKDAARDITVWAGQVRAGFDRVTHDIGSWASDFARVFTQEIPGWINQAGAWFGRFPDMVWNALASLPGRMLTMGENIIQGLINGIEHMFGGVVSAIARIANAIPSGISKILHILSPSQVMHNIGMNIGLGLANGIDASHGHVMAATTNLARGIPGAVSGGAYGARAGAPLQLQISFNGGGGDQVSRAMMQILSHGMRISGGDPRLLISKVKVA